MTTAHRPTWAPARGGEEQGGARFYVPSLMRSSKNQAAHTKMKFRCVEWRPNRQRGVGVHSLDQQHLLLALHVRRQEGQAAPSEQAKKDLRAELEEKERSYFAKKNGVNFEGGGSNWGLDRMACCAQCQGPC